MAANRRPDVPLQYGRRDSQLRRLCCYCGAVLTGRKRDWCGTTCVETYQIASGDQNAARRFLWRRDLGVCALCHDDTVRPDDLQWLRDHGYFKQGRDEREQLRVLAPLGAWDADHTIPIVEGGPLTRENLRTLCKACHRRVTAELSVRRAAARSTTP